MLVRNNEPNTKDFGDVNDNGFRLLPGVNDVPDDIWDLWKNGANKCKSLDWMLKKKIVEEVEVVVEHEPETGKKVVTSISAEDFVVLRVADASALVKETLDLDLLKLWHKAEENEKARSTLLKALDAQIELLSGDVKEEPEEE